MKVVIKFAVTKKSDLEKVVQAINKAAKELGVTYKINSKNQPNYLVDPSKGLLINQSDKNLSLKYQNYTRVVSVIKDVCNNDKKLMKSVMEDLKSQYKSLITQLAKV